MRNNVQKLKTKTMIMTENLKKRLLKKRAGIDGIVVTVGLCIIALVLCVVMKDSLTTFIESISQSLTSTAENILTGN